MTAIMVFAQFITDYPTGSLGDKIGQKSVLLLAFLFQILSFMLLIIPSPVSIEPVIYLFIGLTLGFGNAFSSGAVESWVDNNYSALVGPHVDSDRKIYGLSTSRADSFTIIPSIFAFMIGGIFSSLLSRVFVFELRIISLFILIILIWLFMNDSPEFLQSTLESKQQSYLAFISKGISFLFSSKYMFFVLVGIATFDLLFVIFGNILLFPLFFRYTKSDFTISAMRSFIWIAIMPFEIKIASFSKKFSKEDFLKISFIYVTIFLSSWMLVINLIPESTGFNLIGVLAVMGISILINGTLLQLTVILRRRLLFDLIPSEIRNSVYSLIPTITALFGIPVLTIFGYLVDSFGLTVALFGVLLIELVSTFLIYTGFKGGDRVRSYRSNLPIDPVSQEITI